MVVLGRLVVPYGVKGWLHLHPFGDDPASWKHMPQWWLSKDEDKAKAQWQAFKLADLRPHSSGWIAKLDGVDSRDASEALSGWYFAVPHDELPTPKSGEYYWADLIGLPVANLQGVSLGVVESTVR